MYVLIFGHSCQIQNAAAGIVPLTESLCNLTPSFQRKFQIPLGGVEEAMWFTLHLNLN